MGNSCTTKGRVDQKPYLLNVKGQKMLMDNEEVTVCKWKSTSLTKPRGKEALADEFL